MRNLSGTCEEHETQMEARDMRQKKTQISSVLDQKQLKRNVSICCYTCRAVSRAGGHRGGL